jgi:hypothetical protein
VQLLCIAGYAIICSLAINDFFKRVMVAPHRPSQPAQEPISVSLKAG